MNYWMLLNQGNLQDEINLKVKCYMFVDIVLICDWKFDILNHYPAIESSIGLRQCSV
jgi:hypothetical protein